MREIIGLGTTVLIVAAISYAIAHGDLTSNVIAQAGNSFSNIVRAATLQPTSGGSSTGA